MGISDMRKVIISDFKGNAKSMQSFIVKVKSFKGKTSQK